MQGLKQQQQQKKHKNHSQKTTHLMLLSLSHEHPSKREVKQDEQQDGIQHGPKI